MKTLAIYALSAAVLTATTEVFKKIKAGGGGVKVKAGDRVA